MQLIEQREGALSPRQAQFFPAQAVPARHLLHFVEMRDHRQHSAHACRILLQRVMKMAARLCPTAYLHHPARPLGKAAVVHTLTRPKKSWVYSVSVIFPNSC